jgi:hypothetical protein
MQSENVRPGAPRTTLPGQEIICIEHPCIIKNVDKGIKSLGGVYNLERVSVVHAVELRFSLATVPEV